MKQHERGIVLALCVAAACRVFLFSAAFPYFNNVDEPAHFDLVTKYSHGEIPRRGVERYRREAIQFIVLYGSPEYFSKPGSPAGVPGWLDPNIRQPEVFSRTVASFQDGLDDHEAGSFPVYYFMAGSWLALGRALGLIAESRKDAVHQVVPFPKLAGGASHSEWTACGVSSSSACFWPLPRSGCTARWSAMTS